MCLSLSPTRGSYSPIAEAYYHVLRFVPAWGVILKGDSNMSLKRLVCPPYGEVILPNKNKNEKPSLSPVRGVILPHKIRIPLQIGLSLARGSYS